MRIIFDRKRFVRELSDEKYNPNNRSIRRIRKINRYLFILFSVIEHVFRDSAMRKRWKGKERDDKSREKWEKNKNADPVRM